MLKRTGLIFVATILILVAGCMSNATDNANINKDKENKQNEIVNNKNNKVTLNEIVGNETSPEKKQTLEDSVTNQIEWKLSNNKTLSASKDRIVLKTEFGNNGVVVLKVPETTMKWYNFIVLRNNNNMWEISSVVDMAISENMHTEKQGLDLPMDKFIHTKLKSLDSTADNIWTFANEDKFVVIGRYPRESFVSSSDTQEISINGHSAWIKTDKNGSLLYYFDSDYLIWMTGNLTKEEAEKLANSLPSSSSAFFPAKEQG
ncbi:DUF4367 domain-containing protein [Paenibacillus oleatilyticus]|uniref:DUF4367 domain-containing protein n=1 Tax=Paenibacillus oleatilyticus TaxID=2594886 RepID=UPI001C1F2A80|nr:DUF4367 domain-containing protein [Paenibacillus oleatilyticus]MBU7316036.1 DUF4367 domain-containing protein [Paenibacillus oleatilyticus]